MCSNNSINCQKTAILPFEGDFGNMGSEFSRLYLGMYTDLNIIERNDLLELFNEQDLYPDRVSSETRTKIQELFGADLLVLGSVWHKKHFSFIHTLLPWKWDDIISKHWYVLIRIVDAETGLIYANYYLRDGHDWISTGLKNTYLSESIENLIKKLATDGQFLENSNTESTTNTKQL